MNKFLYDPSLYTHFRPQYPESLFEYLKNNIDSDGLVLECGAGSGQGSIGLSDHFKDIISTDFSHELLSQAPSLPNVYYVQSKAEQLPIRSHSINLVCVAQALHWFSNNDFYSEVKRVLKTEGIIAAWCYNQAMIESSVDQVINKVYLKMTSAQNPSRERQYLYDHYQTIPFPFERISTPSFKIQMNWNVIQLLGYISTWPGILEYEKKFNDNLLLGVEEELISIWGDPLSQKAITWPIHMLMGRRKLNMLSK